MVRNNLEFSLGVHTSPKQEDSSYIGRLTLSVLLALSGLAQKLSTLLFQVGVTVSLESESGILSYFATVPLGPFILVVLFSWFGIVVTAAPQIAMWKRSVALLKMI